MYLGAGQLTEKEHKEHKYTDMGYSFTDKKNNLYYSLFGNKIPTEEKNGKYGLNYLLYKHIDNLLIRHYRNLYTSYYTGEDVTARECFYFDVRPGMYDFEYNGQNFSSLKGIANGSYYNAFDNKPNSILHVERLPQNKPIIRTGYYLSNSGYMMVLSNDTKSTEGYEGVQVNFDKTNAAKFQDAVNKLLMKNK